MPCMYRGMCNSTGDPASILFVESSGCCSLCKFRIVHTVP